MKFKDKIGLSWVLVIMLILPMLAQGQATLRSSQSAATTLLTPGSRTNISNPVMLPIHSNITDESEWIHYDDTENSDSWGFLIGGEEYDVVAKWDADDLTEYDGWEITKIKFIVVNTNPYLKVKVWVGPDFTEIYSQDVPDYVVSTWTEVTLDESIEIDATQELWVGYYVDMTHTELGGIVTATDDGPPVDEYGNLYRFNGSWYSDFNNHNLQVLIEVNLNADFEGDPTAICAGGTVDFTSLSTGENSYSWTFEGGTPSTSTDENPSVVYDTPGFYDVTLEVSNASDSHTTTKTDYIGCLETPAQANQPTGDEVVCTNQFYTYEIDEVLYAQEYEWELIPADAGTLEWIDNVATLETDESWTGDFSVRVRAVNICGDGEWSEELECTLDLSPTVYVLGGGGVFCSGDDGVEITLDDSQTGIDYELFMDGETTGIIVEGTGSELSFGLVNEEGFYDAVGFNDNCSITMDNQVGVTIEYAPVEPATPMGPQTICNVETSEYESEGSSDADTYEWVLSPEEAGTIEGDGLDATVTWNTEFVGDAFVSLFGINDCGGGNSSEELEISVGAASPEVAGEDMVCDEQVEDYSAIDNDGSTYTWEVVGGTISSGQGASMVTVEWGEPGNGSLSVTEEMANGCLGTSENFEVVIDDCTDTDELYFENGISIYPNPVTGNVVHIELKDDITISEIQIINASGKLMMQMNATGKKQSIDISKLNMGLYFIKFTNNDDSIFMSKIIVR